MKEINVLSLFDGMSCGQIALERAGIKVGKYFASEIDKHAIKVAQKNYPDTIHLGNVEFVTKEMINNPIDLLIGGSPCQGFSLAGKQLNFEDPRSKLFFEYVRLLKELKPKYFFLENVRMKQESQDIISEYLGVQPVIINSSLVSAQNRVRLYWTNIEGVGELEDKGVMLKDILVDGSNQIVASRGRYNSDGSTTQRFEERKDSKSNALTTVGKDNLVRCIQVGRAEIKGHDLIKRVYSVEGKCPAITAASGGNQEKKIAINDYEYRNLIPLECERLQTVPDGYTEGVSKTQRYRMLGNGWTVDVISHFFKRILE
jgi:DNA (cytosine-5)-methyltransferase 3A